MKKVLLAILAVLCFMVPVRAFAYNDFTLTLDAANSGTTTSLAQGTGTSTFVINANDSSTYIDLDQVAAPYLAIKITGVTVSQAAQALGGDSSGTSLQILYSVAQDKDDLSSQEKIPIWLNDTLDSATTPFERTIQVPFSRYIQFYLKPSGVTAFDSMSLKAYAGKDASWLPPAPLKLSETSSAFTTTGTTQFWSGTTAYTVVDGCRYVEVQAVGDAIYYTADGETEPSSTSGKKVANEAVWILTRQEFEKFWMSVGGAATGIVNFTQWTAKP